MWHGLCNYILQQYIGALCNNVLLQSITCEYFVAEYHVILCNNILNCLFCTCLFRYSAEAAPNSETFGLSQNFGQNFDLYAAPAISAAAAYISSAGGGDIHTSLLQKEPHNAEFFCETSPVSLGGRRTSTSYCTESFGSSGYVGGRDGSGMYAGVGEVREQVGEVRGGVGEVRAEGRAQYGDGGGGSGLYAGAGEVSGERRARSVTPVLPLSELLEKGGVFRYSSSFV